MDVSEALALLAAPAAPKAFEGTPSSFPSAFERWAAEFKPEPGRTPALISADLYRHFLGYVEAQGWAIPEVQHQTFGAALRSLLGSKKGRVWREGREYRPYLMSVTSAAFFNGWLAANPTLPLGQTSFGVKRAPRPDRTQTALEVLQEKP